jgi:hypothetical protein
VRRLLLIVALLAVVAVPVASASAWVPGTTYYIEESDASDLLEKVYDSAYCDGIARFGKHGEFPYETFHVFDCSVEIDNTYCSDVRYKSVKAKRRNYYRLVRIRQGDCF